MTNQEKKKKSQVLKAPHDLSHTSKHLCKGEFKDNEYKIRENY